MSAVSYNGSVRIVLIATKQLALAKSRLAPALPSSVERAALAEAMFRDVLAAALSSRLADGVAVVTSDVRLTGYTRAAGAIVIDEEFPRGLNIAVRLATTALINAGATTVCTVLSDIPLTTGADIDTAFAAHTAAERGVVLIPSRDCSGTNMMVRRPPDVIATQFGRLSLVRHREDCRLRGIACEVVRISAPALDLDVPADLIEFARTPTMTHTFRNLDRLGLLHG
jgi:2-phospho-L-lactate guanylyltransferase